MSSSLTFLLGSYSAALLLNLIRPVKSRRTADLQGPEAFAVTRTLVWVSSSGGSAGNPAAFMSRYTAEAFLAPCNLKSCEETGILEYEGMRVSGLILIGNA